MAESQGNAADLYKTLIIEIRPRLQSVNVFINLKHVLKDAQLYLRSHDFVINDGDVLYSVPCKEVTIVPESLSCLQVVDKYISFRFSTNNSDNLGTFKSEILQLKNESHSSTDLIFLRKSSRYMLSCVNCSQIFCKNIVFDRILPLPSDNLAPGDWFCHGHASDGGNLDPKYGDLFYSACFVHMSPKLLNGLLKSSVNLICKRCMSWIGLSVNDNCFRVWFNTVCFDDGEKLHKTRALSDAYLILRNILRESLLNSARIILQCQVSNSQTDYVLLWIIERKLNVLMDSNNEGLSDLFVAKVLFKFQSGSNDVINQWMNDVIVSNVSVSKPMMIELLKHLYRINKMFPEDCNTSNDFYISYLPIYDSE